MGMSSQTRLALLPHHSRHSDSISLYLLLGDIRLDGVGRRSVLRERFPRQASTRGSEIHDIGHPARFKLKIRV